MQNGDPTGSERLSGLRGRTLLESLWRGNGAPMAASGTPWASIMAPKIDKCRQQCDPEIDTEKVLKNDANNAGKWSQNDDEHGHKDKVFRKKVILRKLLLS